LLFGIYLGHFILEVVGFLDLAPVILSKDVIRALFVPKQRLTTSENAERYA
jgi:hypothetical protein